MMIRSSSREQVKAWLEFAKLADEWGEHLPCRQAPDLYFSHQGEWAELKLAKMGCSSCPIQKECGAYALEWKEPEGIWGGLTPGERKQLRLRAKGQ